jgi:hypothetical protein
VTAESWLAALDQRHLANLTPSEVTRALRALSSCYVERREKLAKGGALNTAGKRAAFALFYAPQHFFIITEIARALRLSQTRKLIDLGCGTGSAGAALAIASKAQWIEGIDRNAWAVGEATWTYGVLGLHGRATVGDMTRKPLHVAKGDGIIASYAVNELTDHEREALLVRLQTAHTQGASLLVVEPIARRANRWWDAWGDAFAAAGGRADEWRFRVQLPPRQRALAKAAGLDPQELTAKSVYVPGGQP